jgi:hypothetical protein
MWFGYVAFFPFCDFENEEKEKLFAANKQNVINLG